jgi:prepilin-type N-terminal cleavage/methylation domain-containing protein
MDCGGIMMGKVKMFYKKITYSQSGFTLIEIVMALLILSIIIIALTPLFSMSFKHIYLAGNKSVTMYESQGVIDEQLAVYTYGTSDKIDLTFPSGSHEVWGRRLEVNSLKTFLSEPLARTRYVAVGDAKTVLTSADGVSWENKTPVDFTYDLRAVTWGGSSPKKYVAVGTFGTVITSDEGSAWTRVHDTGYHLNDVIWGSTEGLRLFMAVGQNGTVVTSLDGTSWNTQFAASDNLNGVAFAEVDDIGTAYFVVVGNNGTIMTTQDGSSWTSYKDPLWGTLNSITWGNDMFIVVGENGIIITSDDGQNWNVYYPLSNHMTCVSWGRNKALATTTDGKIFDITNPVSPIEIASDGSSHLRSVTWSYNKYVAVGSSVSTARVLSSDEGDIWVPQSITAPSLYGVAGR